jgi:uncharacterized membrane protein
VLTVIYIATDKTPLTGKRVKRIMDLWQQVALSVLNFLHLLATVAWIGGMATNILVTLPSTREILEPAVSGRFIGAVMKRFRRLVYGSLITLLLSGVPLTLLNENFVGLWQFNNAWSQVILIKHFTVTAVVLLAVYSFDVLTPKIAKLAAKGPSPELLKAQKLQSRLAYTGFVLGLIILLLITIAHSL